MSSQHSSRALTVTLAVKRHYHHGGHTIVPIAEAAGFVRSPAILHRHGVNGGHSRGHHNRRAADWAITTTGQSDAASGPASCAIAGTSTACGTAARRSLNCATRFEAGNQRSSHLYRSSAYKNGALAVGSLVGLAVVAAGNPAFPDLMGPRRLWRSKRRSR